MATYVLAGTGMGLAYPRTSVAMLAESGDSDRGFNSAALSIADSLGGALVISGSGVAFAVADRAGADPFVAALALGSAVAALARAGRVAHPRPDRLAHHVVRRVHGPLGRVHAADPQVHVLLEPVEEPLAGARGSPAPWR